jgi:hypothetical protein
MRPARRRLNRPRRKSALPAKRTPPVVAGGGRSAALAGRARQGAGGGPATVRRAVAALRRGRSAIADIEGQLDSLMALLREPEPHIDSAAPDRLAGAARQAGRALSTLAQLRRLLP